MSLIGINLAHKLQNSAPTMKLSRFLLLSFTCIGLFASLTSFSPTRNASLVEDILSQTNKFRRSKGLPALVMNEHLNAIAEKHSSNMAKGRVGFGHGGFSKRNKEAKRYISPLYSFAENVAYGSTTATQVVKGWKNSPGHRKNMLGKFKYIGIGVARDRRGRVYYTQLFAG